MIRKATIWSWRCRNSSAKTPRWETKSRMSNKTSDFQVLLWLSSKHNWMSIEEKSVSMTKKIIVWRWGCKSCWTRIRHWAMRSVMLRKTSDCQVRLKPNSRHNSINSETKSTPTIRSLRLTSSRFKNFFLKTQALEMRLETLKKTWDCQQVRLENWLTNWKSHATKTKNSRGDFRNSEVMPTRRSLSMRAKLP